MVSEFLPWLVEDISELDGGRMRLLGTIACLIAGLVHGWHSVDLVGWIGGLGLLDRGGLL